MSLSPSEHNGRVAAAPQALALSRGAGPRILLAWEHGRNLGHLSRLSAIARRVEAQGAQPVWAVPPAFLQAPQLNGLPHPRFAAPMMRANSPPPSQRIDSFADILLSFGFADAKVLGHAVRAWLKLFETVQADSIVLDYAPAAQLAAQLLGLPAFQITNGFDAPPPDCPIFGINARGPYLERLNAQKLAQISATLAQVGQDVMGRPGPAPEAYFKHPIKVYDCIPETDPYGPRDDGLYVGPLATLQNAEAASWPDHAANQTHTPKLFAYLREVTNTREWLDALGSAPASTLCVWPDASDELMARHSNSRLRIVRHPVDMNQALAQADAVLNYGSTTTVAQALLAGKPQLMLPQDVEKALVARKVVQQGAGLMWGKRRGTYAEALHQLLNNRSLVQAAQAIAAEFPPAQRLQKQNQFVQALVGKSQLKQADSVGCRVGPFGSLKPHTMMTNTTHSCVQRLGTRPPGLRPDVRLSADWEALRQQIYKKAVRFDDQLIFDFRQLLTDANNARRAGRLMWQLVKAFEPQVLIGPGLGATPLLYATALAALDDGVALQVLMIRDKRKDYHQKRWVEGHRESTQGKRAVFMDDFMKNGSALPLVKQALQADKVTVELCAVALFFDLWEPLGSRQISASSLPVVSLFTRHDIGLSRDCFDAAPPLMKGLAPDFIQGEPVWWRFGLNQNTTHPSKCAPVIANGAVFVADDKSTLWCHDLQTGDIRWSTPSLAQAQKGIVQLLQHVDDSVVYGCYDGTVTRLDATDGAVLWRWKIDSHVHATPSVDLAGQGLFINTEQWNEGNPRGHLQCLDWQTGQVRWKHQHRWWPPGSTAYCASLGLVLAPCNDQSLIAVNAHSGTLAWTAHTRGLVRGRPAIGLGKVLVATESGYLECFDGASGQLVWAVKYGQGLWHQFLQITGDCVLVMDGKWHLSAFDLESGELRWLGRLRSPGCWAPVAYGRYRVVLSRQGHLAVFCPEREIKIWEGRIPGAYHQPPAVAQGKLVAASTTSGLLAFDIHPYYEN